MIGKLRQVLSDHRPAGNADMLTCTCGDLEPLTVNGFDSVAMMDVALVYEAHVARALMVAVDGELEARPGRAIPTPLEQAAEAPMGDLSKMRPDSAFAEGVAAGHPVEMTMVKPEECALFVLVDMAGIVNAQAVGLPKPDAGAVLRYIADQWDPERTGSAAIRPAAPRTRPNGDPL